MSAAARAKIAAAAGARWKKAKAAGKKTLSAVGCSFLTTHEHRKVRSIFFFWKYLCPAIFRMQAASNLGRTICPRGSTLFQEFVASAVSNLAIWNSS